MKKNNGTKIFLYILLILFIIFVGLMIVLNSGYYESKKRESIVLTKEKILEYEEMIKNNEPIDLDSYIDGNKLYYGNKVSEAGVIISNKIETIMDYSINRVINVIKMFF
jgi:hypothetical protein